MTDYYYLDAFNNPNDTEYLDHTMRLYVMSSDTDAKLIFVAPILQMPSISGQNSWADAGSSFKDLIGEAYAEANKNIQKMMMEGVESFGVDNASVRAENNFSSINPVAGLKMYEGSEIVVPNTITATYYSDGRKGYKTGFNWFQGVNPKAAKFDATVTNEASGASVKSTYSDNWGAYEFEFQQLNETEQRPLKTIAKNLIPLCLGMVDKELGMVENSKLFNQLRIRAPANYAPPTHKWSTQAGQGSFRLNIGRTIVITGLLVTDLDIKPSKLLTPTEDYYSMTVSITLTQGRKYLANELIRWVDSPTVHYEYAEHLTEDQREIAESNTQTFADNINGAVTKG